MSQADALVTGCVLLAVFVAGLYWQEEIRALREAIQGARRLELALNSLPKDPQQSDVDTLMTLVPAGVKDASRCDESWAGRSPLLSFGAILATTVCVAVAGGAFFSWYTTVLVLVVVTALGGVLLAHGALIRGICAAVDSLKAAIARCIGEHCEPNSLAEVLSVASRDIGGDGAPDRPWAEGKLLCWEDYHSCSILVVSFDDVGGRELAEESCIVLREEGGRSRPLQVDAKLGVEQSERGIYWAFVTYDVPDGEGPIRKLRIRALVAEEWASRASGLEGECREQFKDALNLPCKDSRERGVRGLATQLWKHRCESITAGSTSDIEQQIGDILRGAVDTSGGFTECQSTPDREGLIGRKGPS